MGNFGKVIFKKDLARRISKKYKKLNIADVECLIDIVIEEILEAVLEDKCMVDLHKICKIGIKRMSKVGYDFNSNEHITDGGEVFKVFCKPNNYMKARAKEMSEEIPDYIGE